MWYYYINEENEIMFLHGSQGIIGPFNEISILFDYNESKDLMSTLHKHGSEKDILKHYDKLSFLNQVNPEMFCIMMMTYDKQIILSDRNILEGINKCISTTGYIDKFIKEYIF